MRFTVKVIPHQDLDSFEKRVAANPASPLFARLAKLYLEAGRLEDARHLCERGLLYYPEYATGHLVLGQCYHRLGRFTEARRELKETLILQPQCAMAQRILSEIETIEKEISRRRESGAGVPEVTRVSPQVSLEEEGSIESALFEEHTGNEIVTATLAEIYAKQGAYREAIKTYSVLLRRKPEERVRYEQRIRELEEKWRTAEPPN